MGLFANIFSAIPLKQRSSSQDVIHLLGNGRYDLQITGEERHQSALEILCGPRQPRGVNQFETARLVIEERSSNHQRTVRVEIRGRLVGYLCPEAAGRYRRYLHAKGMPTAYGQCQAVIRGGWKSCDGRKGPYCVSLDIPEFAE